MEKKQKRKRELFELFLKFILTQLTLLIIVEGALDIATYSTVDFNYQPQGPYLVKTSKIPAGVSCHEFYD